MDTLTEIKAVSRQPVVTKCGHFYCDACIKDAVRNTKMCPTCRTKLTAKGFRPVYL